MRLIDADKIRGKAYEIFLCAEPGSEEEMCSAFVLCLIDSEPTIAPPPNDPLTLDELREMDDVDVWVTFPPDLDGDRLVMHALIEYDSKSGDVWFTNNLGGRSTFDEVSEDGGLAYSRKPEEDQRGTTD